jgi:hypothetical protein
VGIPRVAFKVWGTKYSREFTPGMERQEIETRLLSEGIRFFPEPPLFDFVSLGEEVRYSPICAPREVGLLLQIISGRSINPAKLLVTKEPAPNVTRAPLPSEIDRLPERMFALYPVVLSLHLARSVCTPAGVSSIKSSPFGHFPPSVIRM